MINFMKYRLVYLFISLFVLVPGIFYLLRFGLKPSIDFTGGTLVEIEQKKEQPLSEQTIREVATGVSVEIASVQTSGENNVLIKAKPIDENKKNEFIKKLTEKSSEIKLLRFETVGPTLGTELLQKTFVAAVIAVIGILLYVAWAFKNLQFGVSAIIALFHDLLVVVGVFAILGQVRGIEVDSLFVTAILTTMSFSVHDTIVVFDRIREFQKKQSSLPFEQLINQALTETFGRSLNNSLTIIFMLLALFLLGGETVRWFTFALLIGTISGTYSSPFVATPILYTWYRLQHKKN